MKHIELHMAKPWTSVCLVIASLMAPLTASADPICEHEDIATRRSYEAQPIQVDSAILERACPPIPWLLGAKGKLGVQTRIQVEELRRDIDRCSITSERRETGTVAIDLCGLQLTGAREATSLLSDVGCTFCWGPDLPDPPSLPECLGVRDHTSTERTSWQASAGLAVEWSIPGVPITVALTGSIGYRSENGWSQAQSDMSVRCNPAAQNDTCNTMTESRGPVGSLSGKAQLKLGGLFTISGTVTFNHRGMLTKVQQSGARAGVRGGNPACPEQTTRTWTYSARLCLSWAAGVSVGGVGTNHGQMSYCPVDIRENN